MKVKFVRHGQTDLNYPIRKMQGISDYDLNSNGVISILEGNPKDNNFESRGIKNGEIKEFIL